MFSIPSSSSVWRATFQALQRDFRQAADAYPNVGYMILQALDEEKTLPPSLERQMREAGGWSAGEFRGRWEVPTEAWQGKDARDSYLECWQLNRPAKLGYLFGDPAGRKKFEYLAELAWLALPGTVNGKAQAYPQRRPTERWMAFVQHQLEQAPSSYFSADDELWVADVNKDGQLLERRFAPRAIKQGDIVSTGYPDAEGLSDRARRWVYTALATDPFTASAVAIDMLLADPDSKGPFLVSSDEMDAYQKSPAVQNANFLVDGIFLGEGRRFPIYRYWCKPAPGSVPSICPNADPPTDDADRRALSRYLPEIAERFRALRLIKEDETIHWVGRQAKLGSICHCDLTQATGEIVDESRGQSESAMSNQRASLTAANLPRILWAIEQLRDAIISPQTALASLSAEIAQGLSPQVRERLPAIRERAQAGDATAFQFIIAQSGELVKEALQPTGFSAEEKPEIDSALLPVAMRVQLAAR